MFLSLLESYCYFCFCSVVGISSYSPILLWITWEMRMHCEVLPYFNVIGHIDLLEILNRIGKTRPESVSNVVVTKANFNLDASGQPGRLNNDDIDTDYIQ